MLAGCVTLVLYIPSVFSYSSQILIFKLFNEFMTTEMLSSVCLLQNTKVLGVYYRNKVYVLKLNSK